MEDYDGNHTKKRKRKYDVRCGIGMGLMRRGENQTLRAQAMAGLFETKLNKCKEASEVVYSNAPTESGGGCFLDKEALKRQGKLQSVLITQTGDVVGAANDSMQPEATTNCARAGRCNMGLVAVLLVPAGGGGTYQEIITTHTHMLFCFLKKK